MYYINLKTPQHGIETVDHFESYKEARKMLQYYCEIASGGLFYLSSRCVKGYWSE